MPLARRHSPARACRWTGSTRRSCWAQSDLGQQHGCRLRPGFCGRVHLRCWPSDDAPEPLCEDLIIWSSGVRLRGDIDAYTTGSSIMPQKKTPTWRSSSGKNRPVYGNLIRILTVLKGFHDLQPGSPGGQGAPLRHRRHGEDEPQVLSGMAGTSPSTAADAGRAAKASRRRRRGGVPRHEGGPLPEAHGIVGRLVAYCIAKGRISRSEPPGAPEVLHGFDDDVYAVIP